MTREDKRLFKDIIRQGAEAKLAVLQAEIAKVRRILREVGNARVEKPADTVETQQRMTAAWDRKRRGLNPVEDTTTLPPHIRKSVEKSRLVTEEVYRFVAQRKRETKEVLDRFKHLNYTTVFAHLKRLREAGRIVNAHGTYEVVAPVAGKGKRAKKGA